MATSSLSSGDGLRAYNLQLSMMLFLCFVAACGPGEVTEQGTAAFEVTETYGLESPRSVTIKASWLTPDDLSVEFADVRITLSPPEDLMVQKLETLLAETGLRWRLGAAEWPELSRAAPPDAMPMVLRLQLAMLLLHGPAEFSVQRALVNLTTQPASLGLTTLERRGGEFSMTTLALIMTHEGSQLAWSETSGKRSADGWKLKGTRRLDEAKPEPVSVAIHPLAVDKVTTPSTGR